MDCALETRGLSFSFGKRRVLGGLDLKVPAGAVFGLLGRNAAGKTTTLRLIMGMLKAETGSICIEGKTFRRVPARMRARLGYVSQEQHFYQWMRVGALGDFVGSFYPTWDAAEFRRLLFVTGIETNQLVSELSGGTKMKLAITLALSHRPPLLILDEPTAGVDPVVRREILALLKEQAQTHARTVLFSTHQIWEVSEIADHVGIVHEGKMVFQGTLDEARRSYRKTPHAPPTNAAILAELGDGQRVVYASEEVWRAAPNAGEALELDDIFFYATRGQP